MNPNILRIKQGEVEYFTVKATGESAVSERGLAAMSGIPRKTIADWLHNLGENKPVKHLESLLGKQLYLGEVIKKNGRNIKPIRAGIAHKIIRLGERLGHEVATETLDEIGEIGITSFIQTRTGWLPEQYLLELSQSESEFEEFWRRKYGLIYQARLVMA